MAVLAAGAGFPGQFTRALSLRGCCKVDRRYLRTPPVRPCPDDLAAGAGQARATPRSSPPPAADLATGSAALELVVTGVPGVAQYPTVVGSTRDCLARGFLTGLYGVDRIHICAFAVCCRRTGEGPAAEVGSD